MTCDPGAEKWETVENWDLLAVQFLLLSLLGEFEAGGKTPFKESMANSTWGGTYEVFTGLHRCEHAHAPVHTWMHTYIYTHVHTQMHMLTLTQKRWECYSEKIRMLQYWVLLLLANETDWIKKKKSAMVIIEVYPCGKENLFEISLWRSESRFLGKFCFMNRSNKHGNLNLAVFHEACHSCCEGRLM